MASFAPPDEFAAAAFAKWTNTPGADSEVYLVYGGATGWLGGLLVTLLKDSGKTVHIGEARLENREAILRDFEKFEPTRRATRRDKILLSREIDQARSVYRQALVEPPTDSQSRPIPRCPHTFRSNCRRCFLVNVSFVIRKLPMRIRT